MFDGPNCGQFVAVMQAFEYITVLFFALKLLLPSEFGFLGLAKSAYHVVTPACVEHLRTYHNKEKLSALTPAVLLICLHYPSPAFLIL